MCEDISEGVTAGQQLIVGQLARHFQQRGVSTEVVGASRNGGPIADWLFPFVRSPSAGRSLASALAVLWKAIGKAQVVHIHGVWSVIGVVAAAIAHVRGVPYIVSPHGMLQPWLLQRRGVRKKIHLALASKRLLRHAAAIHCVTDREARVLRLIARRPTTVIPNSLPIEWPVASLLEITKAIRERVVLFVGRLHPVKGVDLLIDSWLRLWPSFMDWRLQIVGHDPSGLGQILKRRVHTALGADCVTFVGPVPHSELMSVYDRASIFVLPSHSEVIGIANLEAAARGLPILTTTKAGLDLLTSYGGGVICSPSVDSITVGLRRLLEASEMERRTMGAAGIQMVRDHFTWTRVAEQFERLYSRFLEPAALTRLRDATS